MKKIILISFLLLGASNNYSQDITNTLGSSGLFSIKDGSTTFLTLNQTNGYLSINNSLSLQTTTGTTVGVIYKGGVRFIHDYYGGGGGNTFVGLNSGNFTMTGSLSEARYNTGVGNGSLTSLTTGQANSGFGASSLNATTTGSNNAAFGFWALRNNTTGDYNSSFGASSMYFNTSGESNSAFGIATLASNTTGSNNSAFGGDALYSNTTGTNNSALGTLSLVHNITGYENSAIGTYSLNENTIGKENTAVGYKSLWSNVSGFQNTAVGDSALYKNTGNYNTALGYNAGTNVTTGANLTLIGIDANPSSPTAIDQITLGNGFVNSLRCNVQTITSLSDKRDKKNITELTLGLDFISKLKPRQFNWDKRDWYENGISDGSKIQETPTAGFIAQEFDEVQKSENAEWLNLVLKDNPDKWEATYGNLLPVMIKAIQELKQENDEFKLEIEYLKKEQLVKIQNFKEELVEQIKLIKSHSKDEDIKFSSAGN